MGLISATSTLTLIEHLKGTDFPLGELCSKYAICQDVLQQTHKIESEKFLKFWQEAFLYTGDSLLHLHIHKKIPCGAYHAIELASLSSRTVGEGLMVFVKFFNVINPNISFKCFEENHYKIIEMVVDENIVFPSFYTEMVLGGVVLRFSNPAYKIGSFHRIEFMHNPLGDHEEYRTSKTSSQGIRFMLSISLFIAAR